MRLRLVLFTFLISPFLFAQKVKVKHGDLIFQNLTCGEMCDAINAVTIGYDHMNFNHMGLVVDENGVLFVVEAIGDAVKKTRLRDFIQYTRYEMYVGRVKKQFEKLLPTAVDFALQQVGVPYDNDFIYNNNKYYCSELIYDAFLHAYGKPFFTLYPMTYKEPNSKDFFPVWVKHFEKQGIEIPEGLPGCNPAGMSLDDKIKIIGSIN